MSKRPSLSRQIDLVLTSMVRMPDHTAPDQPPEARSRHRAKLSRNDHHGIYSPESLRSHTQRLNTVVNQLPAELRPKLLGDLSPAAVEWTVERMRAEGKSGIYIRSTLSSIRKCCVGMQDKGWCRLKPDELVPKHLYHGLRPNPPRGSYDPGDIERIIAIVRRDPHDGPEFERLIRLISASGLRNNELARLREQHLDRATGTITIRGKGGRVRTIALDDIGQHTLKITLDTIPRGRDHLWTAGTKLTRRLQDAIRDACTRLNITAKGMHGLRGTFAAQFLDRHLAMGMPELEARRLLTHVMGHGRVSVTYTYVPKLSGRSGN